MKNTKAITKKREENMKLPKIRLRLTNSKSKTKHTLEQMQVCYDVIASQSGVEIWSVEKDCKSIKEKNTGLYIVQVTGYSYDSITIDSKHLELWYNSGQLPFTDNVFDLRKAIVNFNIGMFTAIKDFNFVLEKSDSCYHWLREDYDFSKHNFSLTREQRIALSSFKYKFDCEEREKEYAIRRENENTAHA